MSPVMDPEKRARYGVRLAVSVLMQRENEFLKLTVFWGKEQLLATQLFDLLNSRRPPTPLSSQVGRFVINQLTEVEPKVIQSEWEWSDILACIETMNEVFIEYHHQHASGQSLRSILVFKKES